MGITLVNLRDATDCSKTVAGHWALVVRLLQQQQTS